MAYNIIFYERENGKSEIWDFLEMLRKKSNSNKDARIQYKKDTTQGDRKSKKGA